MHQKSQTDLDLLIIGGGPGGMSAALVAGRSLLKTVIINAENPRSMVTIASHGFLTRDGVHPLKLLEIAKQQVEKYDLVTYIKGFVADENSHLRFVHLANDQKIEREAGFLLNIYEEPATHLPEKLGVDKKRND